MTDRIVIVSPNKDVEQYLSSKLDEKYYNVYDYKSLNIPIVNYKLVVPKYVDVDKLSIPSLNGSKEEILQSAVDYVNKFDYTKYISDPNVLEKLGKGNCQAMSLTFNKILNTYGIENEIVIEGEHMYNEVNLNGTTYNIDFAKDKILLKEKGDY